MFLLEFYNVRVYVVDCSTLVHFLQEISCSLVEQEYWTVVSELDSGIIVEYGADLHTSKHGSGFPCSGKTRIEEDEVSIERITITH